MKKISILVFCLFIFILNGFCQLSQGGHPLEVANLKSASLEERTVNMPAFDLQKEMAEEGPIKNSKKLKFAHCFNVSLNPDNSGSWYEIDNYRVWQLRIKSDSAYSLNIIFSKYYIPEGARLFVFDPEMKTILGAFTSKNNKPYKKLAIYPLAEDELIVQYEEPDHASFKGELEIGEVNHAYINILSTNNRWARRPSQECNVDVNCESASGLENEKRAVCRVLVGNELGTGTLINNTLSNGEPYLLSAFHIYDDSESAETALYDFNYESPACTGLNGSDIQSLSGSIAKAAFDSLDLMLVELSETPPAEYRPYYVGWDATHNRPSNSYTIHHPNGDTKKISHDTGTCDSMFYAEKFTDYGHWEVNSWESGTTEGGSSGAALFSNNHLKGILSGGDASCSLIAPDYFSRFDRMWNYSSDSTKQLKKWLDPNHSGILMMNGYDPYLSSSKECNIATNFMVEDTPAVLPENLATKGSFTGNNTMGITEIAEKFTGYKKAVISGVSLGVSRFYKKSTTSQLTLRIYTGDSIPVFAVKQLKFPMKNLMSEAMNYLEFSTPVEVEGNFFISIVIPETDSLFIYQSDFRPLVLENSLLVMQQDVWKPINRITGDQSTGASLLMQVLICSASYLQGTDTTLSNDSFFKLYPNPASDYLIVEFKERVPSYQCSVFDMTGRKLLDESFENRIYSEIDVSSLHPGIYLLHVNAGEKSDTKRMIIN
ncbi:MAG TPA: T9SS type A sorting domain-containing protein [Prolixibacteraceae bacterium]|nr:T9SS type A sorting domain-containing protein [Prolixibacteraceae bacterium]